MPRLRRTLLLVQCAALGIVLTGATKRRSHPVQFPSDFLWGASSSSHQVEGGNTNNDWYEWEAAGHTKDRSGLAADNYHRFREDFDLAAELGHNATRLSIEWSRVEPEQGVFSYDEIAHYREVLLAARQKGLKTFVTLHHFTNPLWASRQGGWRNEDMPRWFGDYVSIVAKNLGDLVDYWITINEPNVNTLTSYVMGVTPPGMKDLSLAGGVLANWLKAHAQAYHRIHDFYPNARVGFAHHMRVFSAARWWNPGDWIVSAFVDEFWNYQIPRAMKTGRIRFWIPFVVDHDEPWPELAGTLDFIGVNYYTRDLLALDLGTPEKFRIVPNEKAPRTDMGWEIYPQGLYPLLLRIGSFGVPAYITENGIADSADSRRLGFLCAHLREVASAMEDGVDVRGYLHWALTDNFEWVDGFGSRFGLVAIDYATLARAPRASARAYREIIRQGTLAACDDARTPGTE